MREFREFDFRVKAISNTWTYNQWNSYKTNLRKLDVEEHPNFLNLSVGFSLLSHIVD